MNIAIICDPRVEAPERNTHGVQRIVAYLVHELQQMAHNVALITSEHLRDASQSASYYDLIERALDAFKAETIHIVTQGVVGLSALRYCEANGLRFTAAYWTLYPEWLASRHGWPLSLAYAYIRWFLDKAAVVVVPSQSTADKLEKLGLTNIAVSPFGVDANVFYPALTPDKHFLPYLPRPLYVGRISEEKGVSYLCDASEQLPGTVLMVGDGPLRKVLSAKYPGIHFAGPKSGDELLAYYQNANLFVFPSDSDTFGLVLIEALACGLPVAARRVNGPIDVITDPRVGVLDADIIKASWEALKLSGVDCRRFALRYSWAEFAKQVVSVLVPVSGDLPRSIERRRPKNRYISGWALEKAVTATERLLFASEAVAPSSRGHRWWLPYKSGKGDLR
jgi:1,2-diacylglycerol 3-alpha-glucosyltransferase/glucuronosyltransferase